MKTLPPAALALVTLALDAQNPIVLTGAELPRLVGKARDQLVAYRFDAEARWQRVPLQVDERAVVSYSQILQRRIAKKLAEAAPAA